jgi:signal transduction histidine kinase
MQARSVSEFDLDIAQTRIVLSLLAMVSIYVDPTAAGGFFHLTSRVLVLLLCHMAYSIGAYLLLLYRLDEDWLPSATAILPATAILDLLFAMGIAYLAEGQSGPSYVFFVFAIIAVGVRAALRDILRVTFCGVALYLLVIFAAGQFSGVYVMRSVYLAIAGYLVGFFAQLRANYEDRLREFQAQAERHSIARLLHDSYVQSLAGVNLRLESCRELLRRGRGDEASRELGELQIGVRRQFDEVREYLRSLAGVEGKNSNQFADACADPEVTISGAFNSSSRLSERILQIMLEGVRNARKHARASAVQIDTSESAERVLITIVDDGVGFPPLAKAPWTIASHVAETGGRLSFNKNGPARLQIEIPKT